MARNRFFNQYSSVASEQNIIEDLIIESIKIYGIDGYYLPSTYNNIDKLFGEDASVVYDDALGLELFVKTFDGFMGQQDFIAKFGLQIDESITFTVSQKRFRQALTPSLLTEYNYNILNEDGDQLLTQENYDYTTIIRPREGDLIWLPMMGYLYEIKHVENIETFYQLGKLYTFEIKCDRYEYSSERIDTDITQIDAIEDNYSQDLYAYQFTLEDETGAMLDEDGGYYIQEEQELDNAVKSDNSYIHSQLGDEDVIDFSEKNPFADSRIY